jgi:Ca2+-binding RTX toxin-like protein
MYGGNGNDILTGGFAGDGRFIGGQGNDTLIARAGNNIMIGSAGSNTIRGSVGNDIIRGGYGGRNTIYGGAGNDILFAGDQGDEIYGEAGDDRLYGGIGNDVMYGGAGEDFLMGNAGDDLLYADGFNNRLYGGSGNDILRTTGSSNQLWGQAGDDELYAGGSSNFLYGGAGNDSLYGEFAFNRLYGGPGNDGLFGGIGGGATLDPGSGKNRLLIGPGHSVPSPTLDDAIIQFVNGSSSWTYLEIEAMDRGLRALHHRTNGTKILKDTTSNDPMKIVKYAANDPVLGGNDGWNYHELQLSQNPNGTWTETYTREIRFRDFDENNSHQYRYAGLTLIHEISHSWDSAYEINRVVLQGSIWNQFLSLSGWTTQNPNSSAYSQGFQTTQDLHEYQIVGGNLVIPTTTWWYLNSSSFGRTYAAANAKEDWAVSWELAFFEEVYGGPLSALNYIAVPAKVAKVNQLFAALA